MLPVIARWATHPLPAGSVSGMVTSIELTDAAMVAPGDQLFAVGLRPVFAAQGATPAFRDLGLGARGDDVWQLQEFLVQAGHLAAAPNGMFGAATAGAVRNWQREIGLERTGVVRAGDIIFVDTLPARILLSADVIVGALVSPGQQVLSVVEAAPTFTASVSSGMQAAAVPMTGATVTIDAPSGGTWDALVTGSEHDERGGTVVFLAGRNGDPVCGTQCDQIPISGHDTVLNGRSIIAEDVSGPALPLSAVGTASDGTRFAVRADGARVPVTVLAADASRLIVEGVQVGDVVQLFATADDGDAPSTVTDTPASFDG
jgi:peptidoglycan hydrolase-like protein with peptidoglycan-binding domain